MDENNILLVLADLFLQIAEMIAQLFGALIGGDLDDVDFSEIDFGSLDLSGFSGIFDGLLD